MGVAGRGGWGGEGGGGCEPIRHSTSMTVTSMTGVVVFLPTPSTAHKRIIYRPISRPNLFHIYA